MYLNETINALHVMMSVSVNPYDIALAILISAMWITVIVMLINYVNSFNNVVNADYAESLLYVRAHNQCNTAYQHGLVNGKFYYSKNVQCTQLVHRLSRIGLTWIIAHPVHDKTVKIMLNDVRNYINGRIDIEYIMQVA